jgi:hypothetical protein
MENITKYRIQKIEAYRLISSKGMFILFPLYNSNYTKMTLLCSKANILAHDVGYSPTHVALSKSALRQE